MREKTKRMNTALPMQNDIVEREIAIAARPETIFSFFTDPVKLMRWKGINVAIDPRPGGLFRTDINGRNVVRGEYIEVTPFTRLVFTWGWENDPVVPPGSSTVEISLIPQGANTLLRLRHSGLPSDDQRKSHAEGWDHFLPRLTIVASGGDAGVDPWAG